MSYLRILLFLPIAWVLYRLYQSYDYNRRYQALAQQHGCAEPPEDPIRLPLGIDHLWKILMYGGEDILEDIVIPRFETLGSTWTEKVMGTRTIHTADPRNFQTILGTDWKTFEVGPSRPGFGPFLTRGVLCVDGAAWRHARDIMKPSFARTQLNDFESTERHVQNLFRTLPAESADGWTGELDILKLFANMTMDSVTEFFFGRAVGAQQRKIDVIEGKKMSSVRNPDQEFIEAFELSAEYTMQRALLQELYPVKDGFAFRRSVAHVHKYVDDIVKKAIDRVNSGSAEKSDRYVFLEEIVASTQDETELRDGTLTLLTAGRDTIAGMLGWTIFFLARHPEVYQRLRVAVMERFGVDGPETMDYPALRSVTYLQWVLNESLRLEGVVSMTNRLCMRDTILPAGGGPDGNSPMVILKGEKLFLYFYASHRNEAHWGADVKEFKPERWADRRMGWDYIPFGGGPRVCIGRTCL